MSAIAFQPLRREWAVVPFGIVQAVRHEPVMVEEILAALPLRPGAVVVDGTLGLGGHSKRFVEKIGPGGILVGFDWDEKMLGRARAQLGDLREVTVRLVNDDFRSLANVLSGMGLRADGILLDLGLNSAQVDDPERGFSFKAEGPLDMRMDRTRGEPAAALLNRLSPAEIAHGLKEYGDERWAVAIARKIVERRKSAPLRTTTDLVECVLAAVPIRAREKRIHPATRTFQAVRMMVNRELEGLDEALRDAANRLTPDGVLAVLSYHSGEDRIVKTVFRQLDGEGFEELTRKPVVPTQQEIDRNPRARSAKLRCLRRLAES